MTRTDKRSIKFERCTGGVPFGALALGDTFDLDASGTGRDPQYAVRRTKVSATVYTWPCEESTISSSLSDPHALVYHVEGTGTMLKTETNTPAMFSRIHAAAWKRGFRQFSLVFEHGQWWMTVFEHGRMEEGETYSVVDCEERYEPRAKRFADGFDFERV